jgi:hypothetical protein
MKILNYAWTLAKFAIAVPFLLINAARGKGFS